MWFDTHAHLSDAKFDEDRDAVVARAFSSGLAAIVEIADGPEEWPKARALAEKYPSRVWWAAGLHPYYADQSTPALWSRLKELAAHPQFVAVGEIGLDYAKCPIPPDVQKTAFMLGIAAAIEIEKPVIIHCRDAYADAMPIIRRYFSARAGARSPGVVHCFSGTAQHAKELVSLGFYLGVDGPITYPKADALRDALRGIPAEHLVLETDSPYLPPQTLRGQRNEPMHLPFIGAHTAQLLKTTPQLLAPLLLKNSFDLYRLKQPL